MNIDSLIQTICIAAIPLLFAITLHEVAHGWVANKLGDSTALMLGRLTLNPAKHIDPIGTVLVPIITLTLGGVIFGWAKPVPVNWNNLKKPRRDMAIVALAGPMANLGMALVWAMIALFFKSAINIATTNALSDARVFIYYMASFGIMINVVLMVLNLLPLPPLDGSRILSSLLTPSAAQRYERIEPYGIWILLALLMTGILKYILLPPIYIVITLIKTLFHLP
jgi:Zn-dependent protease